MQFFDFFKRNKNLLLVVFFLVIIILLGSSIYYFSTRPVLNNNSQNPVTNKFLGYTSFKQGITNLATDKAVASQPTYSKVLGKLNAMENANSEKDRYNDLSLAFYYLSFLYSNTNNPLIHPALDSFASFAKNNFPKEYKATTFTYYCQDSTCADSPQPPEILKIVSELKNSDLDINIKNSAIQDLLNVGYLSKNQSQYKFDSYLSESEIIRSYSAFTKTGINITVADEIVNFLKVTYPDLYAKALTSPRAKEAGLK